MKKHTSPFPHSDTNKRYHTYDYYLRRKFGGKCARITLDAGLTCPNIDGTRGVGGCVFCSRRGSGDFCEDVTLSIAEQFDLRRTAMQRKWAEAKFIPYFQSRSNTYAPVEVLREKFEAALAMPDVVGLAIATRADCLADDVVEYLHELAQRTHLTVELGLQTAHDSTAAAMNRGHTWAEFVAGYEKLRGLDVCVHIVNGLPGETHEMMLDTARAVAELAPRFVKIHMLHLLEGTWLAEMYHVAPFDMLTLEQYAAIVCDQIELLPPEVVLMRLTGDGKAEDLVAPHWTLKKFVVLNEIDKELVRRASWQGAKLKA